VYGEALKKLTFKEVKNILRNSRAELSKYLN
jgi:hypothetical protein